MRVQHITFMNNLFMLWNGLLFFIRLRGKKVFNLVVNFFLSVLFRFFSSLSLFMLHYLLHCIIVNFRIVFFYISFYIFLPHLNEFRTGK